MGNQLEKKLRPLKTFLFVGAILNARKLNSLKGDVLAKACSKDHGLKITDKTLTLHLRDLESFFAEYYSRFYPDKVFEFFDIRQGRPPEILKDGWDVWRETRRYFERTGYRLPNK